MVEGGAVFSTFRGQTPPQPWSSQFLKDVLLALQREGCSQVSLRAGGRPQICDRILPVPGFQNGLRVN